MPSYIYIDRKDAPEWALKAHPEFRGRKILLQRTTSLRLQGYWNEGRKSDYAEVELATGKTRTPAVRIDNPFTEQAHTTYHLRPGHVVVEFVKVHGKHFLKVHALPEDYAPALPAGPALPMNHLIVLAFTKAYRNSYAGRKNIRFLEARQATGINRDEWASAQVALIEDKYLIRVGSVTSKGKNVDTNSIIREM